MLRRYASRRRYTGHPKDSAAEDADWAELDASDAIDFAVYAVYDAQLAVLNALDARVYADEQAKIAGM